MKLKKSIVNLSVAASLVAATASMADAEANSGRRGIRRGLPLKPIKVVKPDPSRFKPKKVVRGRDRSRGGVIVTCG